MNKINKLLNLLNVNNIDDAIYKVDKLLKYEKYINKLKDIYNDTNNNKSNYNFNEKININIDNNLMWLSNIIKKYKKNESYKNYCKSIMIENKIDNFEDFKNYINSILIKNRKNNGFIVEVKNILCEDEYYSKNKNGKNINKINFKSTKNLKTDINKGINNTENSNDIKFTQNDENSKMVNEYMNTYY